MRLAVSVLTSASPAPGTEFRWDADTDILTARIAAGAANTQASGMTGSVEIEGTDGSWLVLDVKHGRIAGIEVAVWPDVKNAGTLQPPPADPGTILVFPARASQPGIASVEVDTRVVAEADDSERTIHFRIGTQRPVRAVHAARDIVFELDETHHIAGIWMLNVPSFPGAP